MTDRRDYNLNYNSEMSENRNPASKLRRLRIIRERRRSQFGLAVLAGLLAGTLAVSFQLILNMLENNRGDLRAVLMNRMPGLGWLVMIGVVSVCGSIALFLTERFSRDAAGSGIPHIKGVLLQIRTFHWKSLLPVKFAAGLLAIGSGFSLGREGPTVQMGAAAGSIVADLFKVKLRERRHLVACGAGAGLAAAFNAPLAGVLFVIEELQRDFSPLAYGTTLIATVLADVITRFWLGQFPSFHVRDFPAAPLTMLPIFALLGVSAGLAGIVFNQSLIRAQKFGKSLGRKSKIGFLLAACTLIALTSCFFPLAVGSGHGTAEVLLQERNLQILSMDTLLLLLILKLAMTVISYSTGVPGGIFAPMLVLGAVLGLIHGQIGHFLIPTLPLSPAAFAVVGMAALFSAIVRAPITGIVLILEMTSNFDLLFALIVSSMIAYIVAERLKNKPIYEALLNCDLERRGYLKEGQKEIAIFETLVESESPAAGLQVKYIGFPEGCLLIGIERQKEEIIVHGNTKIEPGDMLTFAISTQEPDAYAHVERLCKSMT